MKKLLFIITAASLSATCFANSSLDQLKMQRVEGVYLAGKELKDTEYLEKFATPELRKAIRNAKKHDKMIALTVEDSYEGERSCFYGAYIYGGGQDADPSKPTFKIRGNDVYITLRQFAIDPKSTKTIKYSLKCDNQQCLIDNFKINDYDFKKHLKECLAL